MKGDCTLDPALMEYRQEGDHPQMKGDCTEHLAVHPVDLEKEITPK